VRELPDLARAYKDTPCVQAHGACGALYFAV